MDREEREGQEEAEAGLPRPPDQVRGPRNDGDNGDGDPPAREASAFAEATADEPAEGPEEELGRVQPNKNRALQVARTGGRKLFDEAAQQDFLEWFAATGNVAWSAELAGFNYKTVLRHRMNDPRFAEGWDRAVRQSVARLEAKRLETGRRELPIGIEGDRDAPEMDDLPPERIDAILRDHKRDIAAGSGGGRRKQGRRPRIASNAEVRSALVGRLAAYGVRIYGEPPAPEDGNDGGERDSTGPLHQPSPSATAGPPPRPGEDL